MTQGLKLCALLAGAVLSTSVLAQARIQSVDYDLPTGTLVITGEDLKGTLSATTVKLGGQALTVLSNTATAITAQLPANQGAGEYLLTVKRGLLSVLEAAALGETSFDLSIVEPTPGPAGATGATGPQGPAGTVAGYTTVSAMSVNDSQALKIVTANCPAGKSILGGGTYLAPLNAATYRAVAVPTSVPTSGKNGWTAAGMELPADYAGNWQLQVYALCGTVAP